MTFDRRKYAREYAQRQRDRRVAEANRGHERCRKRHGQGACGALLEYVGETVETYCPACERQRRGICRDCDSPVDGRQGTALRCARCKPIAKERQVSEWGKRHPAKKRAAARRNYQKDPARREAKNAYKRAWRKANRDKVAAQKRRAALRQSEHLRQYHAARRARERARLAARELRRYHGELPLRTCVTRGCSIVVTGRKKKCTRCKAREAAAALRLLESHRGRGRRVDLEVAA